MRVNSRINGRININMNKNYKSSIRRSRQIAKHKLQMQIKIGMLSMLILFISFIAMSGYKAKATTIPGNDINQITYESVHINNGDSMWDIASAHTDGSKKQIKYCMKEIRRINHMSRFELIKAGESIIVPNLK